MGLCLSCRRTLLLLDALGKSHDEEVTKWRENMKLSLNEVKHLYKALYACAICFHTCLCCSTFHLLRSSNHHSVFFQVQKVAQHFQDLSLLKNYSFTMEKVVHLCYNLLLLMSLHQKAVYRGLASAMNLICGQMSPVQFLQFFKATLLRLQVHQLILGLQPILQHMQQQMIQMMMTKKTMLLHQLILMRQLSQCTNLLVTILTRMNPPREMRYDHQTQSHHYFQTYAVRDRVDLSAFSNEVKLPDLNAIQLDNLLPTSTDEIQIRNNFVTLVCRTLKKYIPFFAKLGKTLK